MNMFRYKFFIFLLLILLSFSCKKKITRENANLYADTLITLQSQVISQMDTLFQASYFDDFEIGDFYLKAINKNKYCITKLNEIKYFSDNRDLYNASHAFYMTVDGILKNEGSKLLNIKQKMNIAQSQDLRDELDAVLLQSARKITESQLYFDSVLTVFLGEYGYDVEMDTNTVSHFRKDSLKNK